jgi:hypothetical protein
MAGSNYVSLRAPASVIFSIINVEGTQMSRYRTAICRKMLELEASSLDNYKNASYTDSFKQLYERYLRILDQYQ